MTLALATTLVVSGTSAASTDDAGPIEDRLPLRGQQETGTLPSPTGLEADKQGAQIPPFVLKSVEIAGATAVTRDTLRRLVAGYIGKTVNGRDLAALAENLTAAYRERGYFLSRIVIPPQSIRDGRLRLRAIEGIVASVKVNGLQDDDATSHFADLLSERPARLGSFERALLLLADRYGYRIENTRLLPDDRNAGIFRLELDAKLNAVSLEAFLDNRGTDPKGEDQSFAAVHWNSLISPGDRLSASVFTSPTNHRDSFYAELSHATPWAGGNLWVEWGVSTTFWNAAEALRPSHADFEAQKLWGRLGAPLLRTRESSIWLNMRLESRDAVSNEGTNPPRKESLRILRGSLSYSETTETSRMEVSLQSSHGIDALGASTNGQPNLSRDDARPQFSRLRLSVSLLAQMGDGWSASLAATGQYADGSLPSSEDFYVGGSRFGRGYNYDVISGDHGWATAAELRYAIDGSFLGIRELQLFGFMDAGRTWTIGTEANTQFFASSAGGGLRFVLTPDVIASVEAALPLAYTDSIETIDTTRIFVSLSWWQ